jgi:hypothetical protein
MNRLLIAALAACGALALSFGTARAQPIYSRPPVGPFSQGPPLSPYLDIRNGGGNPAVNYFLGTLPEIERRAVQAQYGADILGLQRRVGALQEETEEDLLPTLPQTGHAAVFGTTGGYFNTGYLPRTGPGTLGRRR